VLEQVVLDQAGLHLHPGCSIHLVVSHHVIHLVLTLAELDGLTQTVHEGLLFLNLGAKGVHLQIDYKFRLKHFGVLGFWGAIATT